MPGPFQISPAQLSRQIGLPDAPLILDVRLEDDFAADPCLIPGSRRIGHADVDAAAPGFRAARAVAVCQRGKKLSEGAAAILRLQGIQAESLEGGFEAWRADGLPALPAALVPASGLWVTRQRPKIDRIACPWLIRRFIDARAEFFYVPTGQVLEEARRLGAVAYDIAGAPISHEWEKCSFDALVRAFDLRDPALVALATIVRAADTDRLSLAPQAAGLLAFSLGLSRLHADDDHAMLEAAMPLYDALYEWCRSAQGERHSWPAHIVTVADQ